MSEHTSDIMGSIDQLLPGGFFRSLRQGHDPRVVLTSVDPAALDLIELPEPTADRYGRREVYSDDELTVVLIVWLPGQFSVPHDHGGSACNLRVMRGVATEQRFELRKDGRVRVVEEDRFLAGSIVSCDGQDIHALGNDAESSEPLVTLHVYQPRPAMTEYVAVEGGDA
jgi:predicted metal-dependent enzyme (double-stranded beta helix superfamily)